ncbi:MAG: LacI family DNA-binding transcriptional regulator [Sphaerochaetaceae bacterium]|nr:LacI family DNA-binding transcriptional regulator [Sphaerochaetaceae bacterium]
MKPTIHDVARLSGVSTGTVSRVLNNKPSVNPVTRERVKSVVRQLGYVPESAARDLSTGNRLTIGIHLAEGTHRLTPFSLLFFQAVMRKTLGIESRVVDLPSKSDGLPVTNVDGVILLGAHKGDPRIEYLESQGIPYVLVGHDIGRCWVAPDDYDGGRQVAKYLTDCGHKHILFVSFRLDFQNIMDRLRGFSDMLESVGCTLSDSQIISEVDTPLDAYRKFSTFIREHPEEMDRTTAVFACSDEIAVGVKAALYDNGYSVPRDISLVGFDDMPELSDGLTTVHQDIPATASIAIELLHDQILGKGPGTRILPVQLVVRRSTGINLSSK